MTPPSFATLRLELRPDSVAVLNFDQPGSKANVLTDQVWEDFENAVDILLANRTEVTGLVLASAKPGIFIAGADLKLLGNAPGPNDPAVRSFIDRGNRTLFKLEALPFPTCAAVDGAALGGGCEVALACDSRICGKNAKFGLPEVSLGLIPGWGGTQRLPRFISTAMPIETAFSILSAGRTLTIQESAAAGFINAAVDSSTLVDVASQSVTDTRLKSLFESSRRRKREPIPRDQYANFHPSIADSSDAVRAVASVMTRGAQLPLREAIALETEAFMNLAGGEESKRLIAAFFAARKK
ncbi:MAG TPA: enoyl-CoA hydratase-related protein [Fimbriiglobus sp.]|jgi:enoyl-CoA hydratase/carnithine racemase